MADLKTYSVLIAWHDNDDEQGEFGDIVRAPNSHIAERIVRARMIRSHWENHLEPGETRRESLSSYSNGDGSYFGRVLDCHEGAIWKAADLEKALREILAYEDDRPAEGTRGAEIYAAAEKLIADIDKL